MKLQLASIYTLILLSGMLFAILAAVFYFLDSLNVWLMLGLTLLFNFILWLASPYIIDFQHRIFYKMRFVSREEFKSEYPELYSFIEKICQKHKISFPKIRIVEDLSPTAYTYGSAPFNARIAFSQGLFHYLEKEEIEAVIAHELGHIVHRDFIVMSIASTILQILYQIYVVLVRTRRGKSKDEKRNPLVIIGAASFVLYFIGTYIVLYLSRIREYYADSFSAQETSNPLFLSSALVKIAYGITTFKQSDTRLIEATKTLGILGLNDAKALGPVIGQGKIDSEKISHVLLFDLVNPWAKILELSSTHPLIGKRLKHLDKEAQAQNKEPLFNIEKYLRDTAIDKKRLYHNFFLDVAIYYLPVFLALPLIVGALLGGKLTLVVFVPALVGIGLFIKTLYRFQEKKEIPQTTVLDLMSDIYASPLKGKLVKLEGRVVGRGLPGYYFSEDMMYQDSTGLIYFDYQAGIPVFGNLAFAWGKLKKIIGSEAEATGWFLRGATKRIALKKLKTPEKSFRSYIKFYSFVSAFSLILASLFLFVLFG
jgi:Zn-dependent protease with chaperone function